MDLRGGLRPYERDVIERVDEAGAHVLLPQGAPTAVVGLELIRRHEGPAVVFGPNVAAQLHWQQTLSRFTDPAGVITLSSLDTTTRAPITLLSWDDLGSATANAELVWQLAIDRWATKLVGAGRAPDADAARDRISRWAQHNPRKVGRTLELERAELTVRVLGTPTRRQRRGPIPQLPLGAPPTALEDVSERVPEAARRLFEALREHGIRTIILDGCDQLTDWRALLLRLLISKLSSVQRPTTVIGLSTVPRSVPDAHRYCRHLVPARHLEVPMPPVVQAGDVAPHRDLVSFVETTRSERERLAVLTSDTRRTRRAATSILGAADEKSRAVGEILAYEHAARPEELRALVLAADEARATSIFSRFLADSSMQVLAPVLLTRHGLITSDQQATRLMASCATSLERLSLRARCTLAPSAIPGATLIAGVGEDWSARTAVILATRAMAGAATSCVVGDTGGPLSQGWDAIELDTLVDLSSLPTVTAARLRGRALRLSGSDLHKVAHVWHVVAYDSHAPLGGLDVRRFVNRVHDRWGLPLSEHGRRVVRGPAAVDHALATPKPGAVDYRAVNARCLTQIGDRSATRARWMADGGSDGTIVTSVDAADLGTSFRIVELLEQLHVPLLLSGLLLTLIIIIYGSGLQGAARFAGQIAALATAALVGATARGALRMIRSSRASIEERLIGRGRAVLEALRECGHVNLHLGADAVEVRQTGPRRFEVRLDDGSDRDARVFATTLTETLAPLNGQSHVVSAGSLTVPVPAALSENPAIFLQQWRHYNGQGELIPVPKGTPTPHTTPKGTIQLDVWEPKT
ncbi:MAG: hypothetical protein ACRDZO_07035 [Egibacteraceae bacterium]